MKKLIAYILLLAMCVALFAGCTKNQPDTTDAPSVGTDGLISAKTYLYNMYKDLDPVTKVSFTRVGVVVIQGVGTYTVTWTSSSDAIKITPNGKMVNFEIPEYPEEEIKYTLTATLKGEDGKTDTVTFEYTVPAAVGTPAKLQDGTYVIIAGNLTLTSLTEDKAYGYPLANEVTVTDGVVSGHKIADVLTIKNVEGGYTIQDAYGRYFYLKGTYNSFNVGTEVPEEGCAVFSILNNGGSYLIVNNLDKKTLAYSSTYSSWGCYPELGDDHNSTLMIYAAVAPEADPEVPENPETPENPENPETPENPSNPSNPSTPSDAEAVSTPKAGTAYKLALIHGGKGNAKLYFTGSEKPNYPWYMLSTDKEAEAITVYLEEVSGGWRLYFTLGSTKTYLDMHKDGEHYSLRLTTSPTAVYKWDKDNKTLVATVEDKECFVGTSGTYDTFSCNKMEYISTSYPAHLYAADSSSTPSTPSTPSEPDEPDEPETPAGPSNISDVLKANSGTFTVKGVVTVVDGKNVYVQDATGAICVRMAAEFEDIKLGDTIIGTGDRADYNGLPQLGNGTYEKSSGATLTAKETTISALTKADICTYVVLKNLTVTEVFDNNGAYTLPNVTVKDSAGNEIQIYKCVAPEGLKVGDVITVKAAVSAYNEKLQLRNTLADEITIH